VEHQVTICAPAEISGIGLHSGQVARLVLRPAPADTGIVFRRVDLAGRPELPARTALIDIQPRRTALRHGDAEVNTCEHLLAAAWALGVDNLVAEIDGAELPGCDGSAKAFADALIQSGLTRQPSPRRTFALSEPCAHIAGGRSIVALPHGQGLRVTYVYAPEDGAFGGPNVFDCQVTPQGFLEQIAPARTFVTLAEAERARAAGLGLGATYDNTLVWNAGEVLHNTLRYPDEPARHKALDVIGDLALCSRRLQAHVIAQRTGHWENLALARRIEELIAATP
jgi:UDP-3-O-acyl N-acetylglucosamine deacetylase